MIMVVQCLAFLTLVGIHAAASAIPSPPPTPFDRASSVPRPKTIVTDRTLFNISWSCLSTIIICAWVSIHPNVPPSGRWKALYRRLELMFWAIIAPELIVACAVRQWFAAREVRDIYNKVNGKWKSKRWTIDHGYLLNMGGLIRVNRDVHVLKEPEEPGRDASGIMTAAYMSRQMDYEKRRQSCELGVLTLKQFKELIQDPKYTFPVIPTAEIRDRSKGDVLSKLIAILQTTWFILQCLARGQQRLALTELELVTLALASLNAITYVFWWHKPLGVQEPIRIYCETTEETVLLSSSTRPHGLVSSEISIHYLLSKARLLIQLFVQAGVESVSGVFSAFCEGGALGDPCILVILLSYGILYIISAVILPLFLITVVCLFLPFPLGILLLLKILKTQPVTEEPSNTRGLLAARIVFTLQRLRYHLTSYISGTSEKWLQYIFDDNNPESFWMWYFSWIFGLPVMFFFLLAATILLLPLFMLLFLLSFIFTAVFGIIASNTVAPSATYVPSFYSPPTKSDKYSRMVVFAFFGVIFGGLHCIGWNFKFPTPFEQHLWRATSLAITAIPFIVAPIDYVLENFDLNKDFLGVLRLTLDLIMTILLFIYVPARLSLVAQALALLRSQPQSAFHVVDWTRYVPHAF